MDLQLDSFIFTKPKKHGDYLVCKVKYITKGTESDVDAEGESECVEVPVTLQFPKMKVVGTPTLKNIELEFKSSDGYSKKVYNFLSTIDNHIVNYVTSHSEEWFGKKIPEESISQMYNRFIKSPKTSENGCTINLSCKTKRNELVTQIINRKDEPVDFCDICSPDILECIAEMKYIIFSKDTCFVQWEICTAKHYKKIMKVAKYGFIEDPDDFSRQVEENSDDELEIHSFF
jgi:hypothetical protein